MPAMQTRSFIIIAIVILCGAAAAGYVFTDSTSHSVTDIETQEISSDSAVQADMSVSAVEEEIEVQAEEAGETVEPETGQATAQPIPETPAEAGILGIRAIGNPNAPIRMTEYFSLTCGHCAHFHLNTLPDLKKRYVETGDLYIRYEEFPLNAPALDASMLARCLPEDRYYGFINLLFKTQQDWATSPDYRNMLIQNAKLAGLSAEKAQACLEQEELRQAIASRIQDVTQKHELTSTPSFIINDGQDMIVGSKPLFEFEQTFQKYLQE